MIHTGSVSIGYPTAIYFQDILRKIYPKQLKLPKNGILPLPFSEKYAPYWAEFWQALSNATNFAFGNRLFLGLMLKNVMESEFGSHSFDLLYDSGHNLVWQENLKTENVFLHRKGACPARGAQQMQNTPFHWTGEPVLIPGSMGASSFILAGNGNANSNSSASHGAGRSLSRGESLKYDEKSLDDFLKNFHIITPIDPTRADIRNRQDILQKWRDEIKKEAPFAFKPISAVIETQVQARIANVVAEVEPIFTIKG
jgi:tRNA-splicing ligase RtcB